ncbi:hypothetical protein SCALM49S_05019 [Streptomyces californicus]
MLKAHPAAACQPSAKGTTWMVSFGGLLISNLAELGRHDSGAADLPADIVHFEEQTNCGGFTR